MPGPIPNREKSLFITAGARAKVWDRLFNASLALPRDPKDFFQSVLNRTLRFGNRLEEISEQDFTAGVYRKGVRISPPLAMSPAERRAAEGFLETCGALEIFSVRGVKYYCINIEWSEAEIAALPMRIGDTNWAELQGLIEDDDKGNSSQAPKTIKKLLPRPIKKPR